MNKVACITAVCLCLARVTHALLVVGEEQWNAGSVLPSPTIASSGDLLETSVASVTGENTAALVRNGITGTAGSSPPGGIWNQTVTTYTFDTSTANGGYNIEEIRLFSGWTDERASQSYKIEYSLVGDDGFTELGTVDATGYGNGSLMTRTYDDASSLMISGVDQLRFTQIDQGLAGSGTVFREFDVILSGGLPVDTYPPVVQTRTPDDGAVWVSVTANLVIGFNENVAAGSGNIVIRKSSDDSVVETIAVTDTGKVVFNDADVTIDPADLEYATVYYVEIDSGAIVDLADTPNAFEGYSGSDAWSFTTVPAPGTETVVDIELNNGVTQPNKTYFQSHNQKVVENDNGIFVTSHGVALDLSTDGGKTFTKVYDRGFDHGEFRPPTIETDEDNNIYLIYPDPPGHKTIFQKFTEANGYTSPTITKTVGTETSAAKFASAYDPGRGRLYHATQYGYLYILDKEGNKLGGKQLLKLTYDIDDDASPQYPLLFLDNDGILHFADTTVVGNYYDSIRYLKSENGGSTWKKMDGTTVSLPVSCDQDAADSTQINLEDEEGVGENTWLANMFVKNGKVHFMYLARLYNTPGQTNRMHYMRFDRETGVREIDSWSDFTDGKWKGSDLEISSVSGYFSSNPDDPDAPLFATAQLTYSNSAERPIGALVSYDNGLTWRDHALAEGFPVVDCVGGSRYFRNERVIGAYSAKYNGVWATTLFLQFPVDSVCRSATWDSTSSSGWGTGSCWVGDESPTFDNGLDVCFYDVGATVLNNNLGSLNRTVRSLNFSPDADSSLIIYLSRDNNDSSPARNLVFDTDGNGAHDDSAAITVDADATGDFTIGSGQGNIVLADPLLVDHNGSGLLTLRRPVTGAFSVTKTGSGAMTLAGASTYIGLTTIEAGTLRFDGGANRINPGNDVLVNGMLDLNGQDQALGTVSGDGTIVTGGGTLTTDVLAPGDGVGTLRIVGDFSPTGTYRCELNAVGADRLDVSGEVHLLGLTLDIDPLATPTTNVYVIATYGSRTRASFGSVVDVPDGYVLDLAYNGNQVALLRDSDGDGLVDVEDPDDDNDGMLDADEAVARTDPLDPNSYLRVSIHRTGIATVHTLRFPTETGATYRLERATNIMQKPWDILRSGITTTGGRYQCECTNNIFDRAYYRIGVE